MKALINSLLGRFGYRVIRRANMPQANLVTFCSNLLGRGFRPEHILDVGANKGDWSRQVRSIFTDSRFTLIEPQIEMKPHLDLFCAEATGARWINAGAGANAGELKLTVFPDTVSSSFAVTEDEARQWKLPQRVVPMVTIDEVCRNLGVIPDFLKLDVEGLEYDVLNGATSLFGKTELILLELTFFGLREGAKPIHEMLPIMAGFGYRVYDFTWFQHRPYDGALGQCEIAFARDDGFLRSHKGW